MRKLLHGSLALLVTVVMLSLVGFYSSEQSARYRREKLADLTDRARARLEAELNDRLYLVSGLAAFVKSRSSFSDEEFQRFASGMLSDYTGIRSLQLAPDAVVRYLTNPEENEAARGHDLLRDPARAKQVRSAIERMEYIIAGPLKLIQGGIAIIGRLPIYNDQQFEGQSARDRFWGFATILIDVEPLLLGAGIQTEPDALVSYSLRSRDENGELGELFLGESGAFSEDEIIIDVAIPNGSWQLAAIATDEWTVTPPGRLLLWIGGVLLSCFSGGLLFILLQRPEVLRKTAEDAKRALDESEERLWRVQKLETIGQLTGGLAHDFNNLLGVIIGSLELLRYSSESEEDRQELLQTAQNAAERGANLTRSMLLFARKQILEPEVCHLNDLINSTLRILSRTLDEKILIERNLASELGAVRIDPSYFESVIMNLAINSHQAMPDGGTLSITTANVEWTQARGDLPAGYYAKLSIADNGIGMSAGDIERAFEPFFTTKQTEGSGLGLSMVYGFVKQSGGRIEISSTKHEGTTVEIYLPIVAEMQVDEPESLIHSSEEIPDLTGLRVLLVEDKSDVRSVVGGMLETLGVDVIDADNADSAMNIYQSAQKVQVLLTDIVMPGANGYELASSLLELCPDLKVVFMTGFKDDIEASNPSSAPMLRKPFGRDELARAIQKGLGSAIHAER
ncbi:MAG: signal transduction histidine kinase [Planctomycetota bacterium]|jgi:signal transduction histidine kinase